MERRHVAADDLAKRLAITPMATQGLHQHRHTSLVLHHQLQHHLVEVGAMIPARAAGEAHDLCVRSLSAVIPAIDMDTRRLETAERWVSALTAWPQWRP